MYSGSHAHARNHPGVSKNVVASGGNTNGFVSEREEKEKEERHRAIGNVNESGQVWTSLDLGGQSLKVLAKPVFMYTFLTRLFLCNNKISYLPHDIGRLRGLSHLDASANQLTELPAEIGMLSNLREFLLFDNQLETLPMEMGSLYHLEMLGIEGNPLDENMKSIIVEEGTEALIKTLRENAEGEYPLHITDSISTHAPFSMHLFDNHFREHRLSHCDFSKYTEHVCLFPSWTFCLRPSRASCTSGP